MTPDDVPDEAEIAATPSDAPEQPPADKTPDVEPPATETPATESPATEPAADADIDDPSSVIGEVGPETAPASDPQTETATDVTSGDVTSTDTPGIDGPEEGTEGGDGEGGDGEGEKKLIASSTRPVSAEASAPTVASDVPGMDRKDIRKARKKEKRRKHRWRRRITYALSFILFLAVAGAGTIFFYARYRFDEIPKIHSKHLIKQATAPGQPFNVLLVGSDSRAFVSNPTQVKAFGDSADAGGQRSDVTMVARFVPATKTVTVISIPRDLWVNIPANSSDISGMNRINAAYNSGPDLLVQTIEDDLHIPINHYISVGFDGFSGMVNALGGVTMDFPTQVKDAYTGLNVTTTGCQVINGTVALQLVRSRHLYYMSDGQWEYDGLSDFSRIRRQDSFFRAVLAKVNTSITNPLAINGFISAAVGNLAIDDTLTEGDLLRIATEFRGLSSSHLTTETLPTTSYVTDGGADVLLAAQPYADQMIAAFNQLGVPKPSPTSTTTTTTAPPLENSAVPVDVLNASGGGLLATDTAEGLRDNGFVITGIDNAPSVIAAGNPSEIFYGPTGLPAAKTLAASLTGKVTYVPESTLTGNNVTLWVANANLTVKSSSTTTTTPNPSTTTNPASVYFNKQPEPWNPVPCTLGAPAPVTTTTTAKATTAATPTKKASTATTSITKSG